MYYLDLFSGIGGFPLGAHRAGMRFDAHYFSEVDPWAVELYQKRFPDAIPLGDIRGIDGTELPSGDWVISGGDPCQSHSNARRAAEGTSLSLGGEYVRIVEEMHPLVLLRENPAVVRKDAEWTFQRFRDELHRLGYVVLPVRIRACCIGFEHRRERMFLLAALPHTDREGLEGLVCEELAREDQWGSDPNIARSVGGGAAPRICGKSHGIPHRVDRLRGLGNAIVPQIAELIFRQIGRGCEQEVH